MEVPLESPAGGVARLHDARPGRSQLGDLGTDCRLEALIVDGEACRRADLVRQVDATQEGRIVAHGGDRLGSPDDARHRPVDGRNRRGHRLAAAPTQVSASGSQRRQGGGRRPGLAPGGGEGTFERVPLSAQQLGQARADDCRIARRELPDLASHQAIIQGEEFEPDLEGADSPAAARSVSVRSSGQGGSACDVIMAMTE